MTAYLDSSVVLRIVLQEAGALREWRAVQRAVASALVEVECLRTLDRLRRRQRLADADVAVRREVVFRLLEEAEVVVPTQAILVRAAQPLPTELGTLDAIHLASALGWRDEAGEDLMMATHDIALATAARASGLRVVGVD